jgi:hypothetical protein
MTNIVYQKYNNNPPSGFIERLGPRARASTPVPIPDIDKESCDSGDWSVEELLRGIQLLMLSDLCWSSNGYFSLME